ncbi:MAG: S-layer homology domain-containing protein [Clostridia bacterium]|nr:S-layer homology domain-containing protein [Clostridia bacterium]
MRKTLSILLALILVISCAVPAFAGTDESTQVKSAITYLKGLFPELNQYPDFDYSFWKDEETNKQMLNLNWNEYETNKTVSVSIDDKLVIHSMYLFENTEGRKGLGDLTKDEGIKTAQAFLNKIFKNQGLVFEYSSLSIYPEENSYSFRAVKNGIPVENSDFSVSVDKFTGKVTAFSGYSIDEITDSSFASNSGLISKDTAKGVYKEKLAPALYSFTNLDYETGDVNRFFAYAENNWFGKHQYIDAKTGEIAENYIDDVYYGYGMNEAEKATEDAEEVIMSDAEVAAIESAEGSISPAEADAAVKSKVSYSFGQRTAVFYEYDQFSDVYTWNISYKNGYASVNAFTKELLQFDSYPFKYNSNKTVSTEKAKQTAESFLKSVSPEKFEQTVLLENKSANGQFVYARLINGVPSADEQLEVTIDENTGKVRNYDVTWYAGDLPEKGSLKTGEDAFNALEADAGFGLKYVKTAKDSYTPVYDFVTSPVYLLDAATLKKLDYSGEPYFDNTEIAYNDISGKWYEGIVEKLYENGYYLPEKTDKFEGNEKITQANFLAYIFSRDVYVNDVDDLYDYAISEGVIKKNEKAPDVIVTRQGAAKILVRCLGLEQAALHTEIYKNLFTDKVQSGYEGYVALAGALKIMNGDSKNRFNGMNTLSNAQAAAAILNMLLLK